MPLFNHIFIFPIWFNLCLWILIDDRCLVEVVITFIKVIIRSLKCDLSSLQLLIWWTCMQEIICIFFLIILIINQVPPTQLLIIQSLVSISFIIALPQEINFMKSLHIFKYLISYFILHLNTELFFALGICLVWAV